MHAPDSQEPERFDDLESRLRRLSPAPPSASLERRLGRELDALSENRRQDNLVWMRFAPLAAAACLVLAGAWLLQRQLVLQGAARDGDTVAETAPTAAPAASKNAAPVAAEPRRFVSPPPLEASGIPADRLVPVSSQQILREASPGGVIELPDQAPARELRLEYDDAWHWHDPETGTNVRVFRPREEVLLVPVETD